MTKRLKKAEREAIDHLWQAHDLLKGNGTAKTAIKGVVEILQSSNASELTSIQYDNMPVNARPLSDPKRRGLIMRHGAANGRYFLYRTVCPESGKQVEIDIGPYKTDREREDLRRRGIEFEHVSIADARAMWTALDARRKDGQSFTRDGKKMKLASFAGVVVDKETEYTVAWLCDKYLREYAFALNVNGDPVKRSAHEDEIMINKHLLPDYGNMPLAAFDAAVIDDLIDNLELIPRTQQKMLSLLTVMNKAGRKNPPPRAKIRIAKRWIPKEIPNPMPHVTPIVTHTAARYASSDDEVQRYFGNLNKLPAQMADVLTLQAQTVSRIAEVSQLPWSEIDLDAGVWNLPADRAKNKHAHRVYLSDQSMALLRRRRDEHPESPWVFPSPYFDGQPIGRGTPMQTIGRNREKLEVDERFSSHTARRRALSWMKSNGINKEIRDAVSNHIVSDVDAVYTESADMAEPCRLAVQRWCDFLDGREGANVIPIATNTA